MEGEIYKGDVNYCKECKIVFNIADAHAVVGCTDDVYHALFITSYEIDNKNMMVYHYLKHMKKH